MDAVGLPEDGESAAAIAAAGYSARGWWPVPILPRSKSPRLKAWPSLRIKPHQCDDFFPELSNVGLILGEPSGWLVDVDLDCAEAVAAAETELPPTAITGRASKQRSHWWFVCRDSETRQWRGPSGMIIELRSTGAQTVVGPSIHDKTGELIEPLAGEPVEIGFADLVARCERIAIACGWKPKPIAKINIAPRLDDLPDEVSRIERASAYLATMPPSIEGAAGSHDAMRAVGVIMHGFALSRDATRALIQSEFNPRCEPPWSDAEIEHKLDSAESGPLAADRGWMLRKGEDLPQYDPATAPQPKMEDDDIPASFFKIGGFLGAFVEHDCATAPREQPGLSLAAAIATQSVLCGRRVWLADRRVAANVYLCGIAPTGMGKDHSRGTSREILHQSGFSDAFGGTQVASGAALNDMLAEHSERLLLIDEFGLFLESIKGDSAASHVTEIIRLLMELYTESSGSVPYKGKAYSRGAKRDAVAILRPFLSLYCTTTPQQLYSGIDPRMLEHGLLGRFLFVPGRKFSPLRPGTKRQDLPPFLASHAARWNEWTDRAGQGSLHELEQVPSDVHMHREATAASELFAATCDARYSRGKRGDEVWSRAWALSLKLALIAACSDCAEHPIVSPEHYDWASGLTAYLIDRMASSIYDNISESKVEFHLQRIRRLIKNAGKSGLGRNELARQSQWVTHRDRQEILKSLGDAGEIASESASPKSGGPARVVYYWTGD